MGALGPIAGLLQSAGIGGEVPGGGQSSAPPIGDFTGLGAFLKTPAGGTALFNNILYSSSFQEVPIDFLANGYYTGIPPLFGGPQIFQNPQPRFDLLSGQRNLSGVDAVLAIQNQLRGGNQSFFGNGALLGGDNFGGGTSAGSLGGLGSLFGGSGGGANDLLKGLLLGALLGGR